MQCEPKVQLSQNGRDVALTTVTRTHKIISGTLLEKRYDGRYNNSP